MVAIVAVGLVLKVRRRGATGVACAAVVVLGASRARAEPIDLDRRRAGAVCERHHHGERHEARRRKVALVSQQVLTDAVRPLVVDGEERVVLAEVPELRLVAVGRREPAPVDGPVWLARFGQLAWLAESPPGVAYRENP